MQNFNQLIGPTLLTLSKRNKTFILFRLWNWFLHKWKCQNKNLVPTQKRPILQFLSHKSKINWGHNYYFVKFIVAGRFEIWESNSYKNLIPRYKQANLRNARLHLITCGIRVELKQKQLRNNIISLCGIIWNVLCLFDINEYHFRELR